MRHLNLIKRSLKAFRFGDHSFNCHNLFCRCWSLLGKAPWGRGWSRTGRLARTTNRLKMSSLTVTSSNTLNLWWCIFLTTDGAVSTQPNASRYIAEGKKTSINCTLKDEAFQGWFMNGEKIPDDPSRRRHVKSDGNLWYSLNIRRVNRTDDGPYECRGESNKAQVMLYVECKYCSGNR